MINGTHVVIYSEHPEADRAEVLLAFHERESYSLAFHPDYAHNGFVYVFSNFGPAMPRTNVISRFSVTHDSSPRASALKPVP